MHPQIEKLLVLQNRDRKLKALRTERTAVPIERKQAEERLAAKRVRVTTLRDQAKAMEVERKSMELEVQAKRDAIGKFRGQQSQTRRNEEFQALHSEIARHERLISEIEDRELELMEKADLLKTAIAAAEKELEVVEREGAVILQGLDTKAGTLDRQIAEMDSEKQQLAEGVEPDVLNRYTRLFASKGDVAIVPVEHEVCMGCHMKVTTQSVVMARGGHEIVSCPQCGRMLYCDE